jgi:hypothetical protein
MGAYEIGGLNVYPLFSNAEGTIPANYLTSSTIALDGVPVAEVTTDYSSTLRDETTPRIGAFETTWTDLGTKLSNVEMTKTRILSNVTGIVVPLNGESIIELYNVNGLMIDKTKVSGTYTHNLNKGMYIISVNGKATKFIKE